MLFQTPEFAIFLAVLVTLVAIIRSDSGRKLALLAGSYFFYMWWNPIFVLPLVATTLIDFYVGRALEDEARPSRRRLLLVSSLCANLGLLGYFKYFDFFVQNVTAAAKFAGLDFSPPLLHTILPIGISFYTFHSMSYTIDVYRREIPACRSMRYFALFITFFPVLVAGPILRARSFLPQLEHRIRLQLDAGIVLLFLRGLVKKVIIADNVSLFVEQVFRDPARWPSLVIWAATIAFSIQIYCDFSGYSDMARALAKIFGLEIPLNFDRPYFASNPSEFWRRWHISLSSWLRDYLYIPLGGKRRGEWKTVRNLLITMLLGGLWHGARWNFVLWGGLHGLLLAGYHLWRRVPPPSWISGVPASLRHLTAWALCQYCILVSWIAFRVHDIALMKIAMRKFILFDFDFALTRVGLASIYFARTIAIIGCFWLLHLVGRRLGDLDVRMARLPLPMAAAICAAVGFALFLFWPTAQQPFIYFQF